MHTKINSICSQLISFHTLFAHTFAFRYICNDMKINMVYNIHCYISIYHNQNFYVAFKVSRFLQKLKGEKVVKIDN